jgi:hypothetical protein
MHVPHARVIQRDGSLHAPMFDKLRRYQHCLFLLQAHPALEKSYCVPDFVDVVCYT